MDRGWINTTLFSPAYLDGVAQFMQLVRDHFSRNEEILCPCRRCLNHKLMSQSVVEDHINIYGMSRTYTRWIHHGESNNDDQSEGHANDGAPVNGEDQEGFDGEGLRMDDEDSDEEDDSGVPSLIEDLYTAATQGKNGPNMVSKLIEEGKHELYPGCSEFSRLSFLIKLLHIKVYNRITNSGFNSLLRLLSLALPCGSTLPKSYNEAKSVLREVGLGYESIHVCKYDCALFWKEHAKDNECPVCGESRWKNTEGTKRIPQKILRYFPIIPRLQRLFFSKAKAEHARWHKEKRLSVENEMRHPADGEAWKDFDNNFESFAQDARNIRLGLATDGFNPFGNMSNSYSMWPVIVIPYNFPPWMCMDQSNYLMALLIPGPKAPGKDFHVYMQPLIEDMIRLWNGVPTYDAYAREVFSLQAAFIWEIHDFPALGTLSGRCTKGYFACVHCDEEPCSQSLRHKIGFVGHRRFLPSNHPWRKSKAFNGKHEKRDKPRKFSTDEVLNHLEKVKDVTPGKHPTNRKRKRTDKDKPNWYLKVSLFDLPYWSKLKLQHNLDIMHIEKNICDNILGTLLDIEGKSKDTISARLDLQDQGIRKELHLKDNGNSYVKPPACYTMSKDQKKQFCQFLSSVKFPDGYASNLARCVDHDTCKVQGLKTHDCHILLQRILSAGIRGLVRKDIYEAIAELGNFFRELCSKTLKVDVLHRLKSDIPIILCKLEKIYPPAFFDVMMHLAIHLPDEAILRGPVQYGWMYPIERLLCTFKNFVRNKARPEGCIAEAYVAKEALKFCSGYFDDIQTRFSREERNKDGWENILSSDLSIFSHGANLLGASKLKYLHSEYDKMVWYVLNNCAEVDKYKDMFRDGLGEENADNIDQRLEKEFPTWFENHIGCLHRDGSADISEDLYALSCGPDKRVRTYSSCIVNGVRYHTVAREKNRKTQNCGVKTEGSHKNEAIDFYGVLTEVIELSYITNKHGSRSVILFRCEWFDLQGKRYGMKNDGYFKSINVQGRWYKDDPFILSTQASQVFYLQDTKLGKCWLVVQDFGHRQLYDVLESEKNQSNGDDIQMRSEGPYQQDNSSPGVCSVTDVDATFETLSRDDEYGRNIEAAVVDKIRNEKGQPTGSETDSEDEDETLLEYCSDNEANNTVYESDDE